MNTRLETLRACEAQLNAGSDALAILSGLFTAMRSLDKADADAVARAGRYIADDFANMLDVDAENLRIEAARMAGGAQ
ncbi:hypothetical protein [Pseudomonas spirodelae]|uniref:Uncharacterized protein n=1 Tax=Pseudomonas spirodelae TaxID=3101751 RepID=A0ABU5PB31_9PSED|nr:hypothetical protein [Pseudomonas sp. T5W1]MEA1606886.1 hypothetical protein [Pseudomonas sp. T5W1]